MIVQLFPDFFVAMLLISAVVCERCLSKSECELRSDKCRGMLVNHTDEMEDQYRCCIATDVPVDQKVAGLCEEENGVMLFAPCPAGRAQPDGVNVMSYDFNAGSCPEYIQEQVTTRLDSSENADKQSTSPPGSTTVASVMTFKASNTFMPPNNDRLPLWGKVCIAAVVCVVVGAVVFVITCLCCRNDRQLWKECCQRQDKVTVGNDAEQGNGIPLMKDAQNGTSNGNSHRSHRSTDTTAL